MFRQINFISDHSKFIMDPVMGAVTYLDPNREAHTYRFELLALHGAKRFVVEHLQYALTMVGHLRSKLDSRALPAADAAAAMDEAAEKERVKENS